jgi:putative PIN family toxin of toxin-antitoxin system
MNLIFDTNVLVAAFSTHGMCNSLFEYALENCTIVLSDYILDELHNILINKFKMPEKKAVDIRLFLIDSCIISDYRIFSDQVSRDKYDDPVLGIIDKKNVDYLITGDKDLLVLKNYKNVPIVSPRKLWNIFRDIN